MVLNSLFNIVISPLETIFDAIFSLLQESPGIAIIVISLVMNILALPLYKRADAIQEEERNKAASMSRWVDHIKKTFKGDERYMMLTEYYRLEHYKPIYALRSMIPLLLQIPFFVAAYHYLSNQPLLNNVSFWFLNNLGQPDQLIHIGDFRLNLMPILMTLLNFVSSFIYLRGFPLKDKIQTYGIAVIFLVLLYNRPSGLVFYWTLNQVFSLAKNVFMKLVTKKEIRYGLLSIGSIALLTVLLIIEYYETVEGYVFGILLTLLCQIPLITTFIKKKHPSEHREVKPIKTTYFILGAVFLTVFLGITIPISVINASPAEFMVNNAPPWEMIINNVSLYAGIFIFWLGIYYALSDTKLRNIFTYVVWILSGIFLLNYMVFPGNYGMMSTIFVFDTQPIISDNEMLINGLVVLGVGIVLGFLMFKFKKIIPYVLSVLIVGSLGISVVYGVNINDTTKEAVAFQSAMAKSQQNQPSIPLSKTGKNVIVIMLDRAISGFVPYIMNEKPELAEKFSGFTYYPNTLSFGTITNVASPALFGGYEYMPAEMDNRDDTLLVDKHNEALKLMPTLFSSIGYQVSVCDVPYGNYQTSSDLSIYDGYQNVKAFHLAGQNDLESSYNNGVKDIQNRNLLYYCLFRTFPSFMREILYHNGQYLKTMKLTDNIEFLKQYGALCNLSSITTITESDENTFFMMDNNTAHNPTILREPEYEPTLISDNDSIASRKKVSGDGKETILENISQIGHYHVNMASYLKLGDWFDYLKEQGVYDNTRIIFVSDHGFPIYQFKDFIINDRLDVEQYNPVLMVKDFNNDSFEISDDFMTNADVPSIAMNGLIDQPINPFTGNTIDSTAKKGDLLVCTSENWHVETNNGTTFDSSDGQWWIIKNQNIFNKNNWERVK